MAAINKSRDQRLDEWLAVVEVSTTALQPMPTQDPTKGLARAGFLVDSTGVPIGPLNPLPIAATSVGYGAVTSKTRPNNTDAYGAGDVIGSSTGTSSAFQFDDLAGAAGGDVIITGASLEIDISAVPSGMTTFNLALYNVTPPSAYGDAATWDLPSEDRASFLGIFSLGTPVDLGATLYVETNQINKQVTMASANLFGYLITVAGYTPAASTVFKVTLHTVGT